MSPPHPNPKPSHTKTLVLQLVVAALVIAGLWWLFTTTQANLSRLGVQSGFQFLAEKAGFSIPQTFIDYSEDSTVLRACLVALINTGFLVIASIVLASLLGVLVGIARISPNALVARLGTLYVETFRNIPVLLQIFFWYYVVLRSLPPFAESFDLGGLVFLNNRGLYLPEIHFGGEWLFTLTAPVAGRFNYTGGFYLMPEFLALWVGLSMYNASYIAEIVRSGFLAVPHGQTEAGRALGLRFPQIVRLITLPLALRVIVPPLATVYMNIFKSSSLGAAIAYPEIVAVLVGTINNLVGQPLEIMAITLVFFVSVSLLISYLMNRYNRRIQLKG